MRFGPGPVFAIELVTAARRWQTYALRAAFVLTLLAVLGIVYLSVGLRVLGEARNVGLRQYAQMGEAFATAVLGTQLVLVLLAAPAATAGAICLDKSRGNLTLLMATELTSREIVLGKLFARLLPMLGLIAVSLPVMFLATLLGGISADLLTGAAVVMAGAAAIGCSLALLLSVFVGRTQDALLITYMLLLFWLLPFLLMKVFAPPPVVFFLPTGPAFVPRTTTALQHWMQVLNPYGLLVAPLDPALGVDVVDYLVYVAVTLGVSALLLAWAAAKLRSVVLRQANRPAVARRRSRTWRWRSERLLSRDPIRWYERFRRRPGMAARFVGVIFALMSLAAAGLVVYQTQFLGLTSWNGTESPTVNSVIVAVALLLVTVGAVTALGDERARGSLDILLVTPLPTAAVLWAKWRSAFSLAPRVLFLTLVVAWATWDARLRQAAGVFWPTEPTKPVFDVFLVLLHPLAAAAMLTSLGLLLATWCKRFGQAVGLAVAAYIVIGPAWYLVISSWMAHGPETSPFMMFSPLFAARELTMNVRRYYGPSNSMCFGAFASMAAYLVLAVFFYVLTLLLFDRKMGRTSLPEAKAPRTDVPDPDHAILTASS